MFLGGQPCVLYVICVFRQDLTCSHFKSVQALTITLIRDKVEVVGGAKRYEVG
jgi:hypothetical protein